MRYMYNELLPWRHPPVYKAHRNRDKEESGCLKRLSPQGLNSVKPEKLENEEIQDERELRGGRGYP